MYLRFPSALVCVLIVMGRYSVFSIHRFNIDILISYRNVSVIALKIWIRLTLKYHFVKFKDCFSNRTKTIIENYETKRSIAILYAGFVMFYRVVMNVGDVTKT